MILAHFLSRSQLAHVRGPVGGSSRSNLGSAITLLCVAGDDPLPRRLREILFGNIYTHGNGGALLLQVNIRLFLGEDALGALEAYAGGELEPAAKAACLQH